MFRVRSLGFSVRNISCISPHTWICRSKNDKALTPLRTYSSQQHPRQKEPQTESWSHARRSAAAIAGSAAVAVALGIIYQAYLTPATATTTDSLLDERRFRPFSIVQKEIVSSTSAIFTLRPLIPAAAATTWSAPSSSSSANEKGDEEDDHPLAEWWARGVWSVEFKQPQLQIARSYTPLPPCPPPPPSSEEREGANLETERGCLRFLIRREKKGEVSTYLSRLPVGASIEVRGPRLEYAIPDGVGEVLFLAGGTGIAPALQMTHALLRGRSVEGGRGPKMRVLWANRTREDCVGGRERAVDSWWGWWSASARSRTDSMGLRPPGILVQELQELEASYGSKFSVDYLVDEEGSFIDRNKILRHIRDAAAGDADGCKKLLVVSGPDGFVNYFAGAKVWEDGKEVQGPVRGVLGRMEMQLDGWTVVKL